MNGDAPGVLEVFTGNRKMIFGVLALFFALLFALASIYRSRDTYSKEGIAESGKTIGIAKRRPENEGVLKLISARATESETIKVALLDNERRTINEVSLGGADNSVRITSEMDYFKPVAGGSFNYRYEIKFSHQPFRLLAVPAGIFTVLGVVAIYKGFEQYMANYAEEKVSESEVNETGEEERPDVDFMGKGLGETKDDEQS